MMISRRLTAAVGFIALLMLGACQKKESDTPAQKKSETGDAAKQGDNTFTGKINKVTVAVK